jgi:UDP-4-amino-4,6-dideoxy-N-acetyl-beta-L-altrosamine N-acetyltransferase
MQPIGTLRTIRDDELELMLSWRNAPSVRANMYTRHEISIDEHRAWWERTRQRDDQRYFMYENAGKPWGIVGFNAIDPANQHAFWAFYAAPDAPRGTGTFMEFLALDHAFEALKLHKLSCEVLAFNAGVIKLHQKFGFTVEGIFRAQHKMDDQFVDIYRLAMLASEWDVKRPELQAKLEKLNRN